MFNPSQAIALLKQHGVYGIGGSDGCACTSVAIHGIGIDISCRKADHSVRVYSHSCDSSGVDLQPVMDVVLHDLGLYLGADPIKVCGYTAKFVSFDQEFDEATGCFAPVATVAQQRSYGQ